METSSKEKFYELSYYTLEHPDTVSFIHQHIVDAFQAQTADKDTKPISLTFSLVGLYLCVEKNYSGRQVQQVHMRLAQNKGAWPKLELPGYKGEITISDVLKATPGKVRDLMIKEWCTAIWMAYKDCHETIRALVKTELNV